jgi:hypothetical protein
VYVLIGRFIDGAKVKGTFDKDMFPEWIWECDPDSEADVGSPDRSRSSPSGSASSPADSVSSSGDGLSSPVSHVGASAYARSLAVSLGDAIDGQSKAIEADAKLPIDGGDDVEDDNGVADGVDDGTPLRRRRSRATIVLPFEGSEVTTDSMEEVFPPTGRATVAELFPRATVPVCDLTENCKACGQKVRGVQKCTVCKCPLDPPGVCSKKRRITVDADGVYWCEDCVVDTDTEVLPDEVYEDDVDDADGDGSFSVQSVFAADAPSPARSPPSQSSVVQSRRALRSRSRSRSRRVR